MRSRLNLAIPALLAMILIIFLIAWAQTASSISPEKESLVQRCGACHTMEQEVASWQSSTHKDVACTECHADPGLKGWAHMQIARVGMMLKVRQSGESQTVSADVPNRRCLDCHARQMPWVMQDLEPPNLDERGEPLPLPREELAFMPAVAAHDLHLTLEQPLNCTDCHNNVSHRAPEGAERRDDFHQTCQNCHAQEQVRIPVETPVLCAACHLDLEQVAPADHKDAVWRVQHGELARNGAGVCQACHLMPDQMAQAGGATVPVAGSASDAQTGPLPTHFDPALFPLNVAPGATADGCMACHGVPMPHPESWLKQHTAQFRQQPGVCLRCHGTAEAATTAGTGGQPATPSQAATVSPADLPNTGECAACHGVAMPHPGGYLAVHGTEALANPGTCANCHSESNPVSPAAEYARGDLCTSCHAGVAMPHATGYLVRHGAEARQNPESCVACHSAANPVDPTAAHARATFCTECHGGVTMPHPEAYLEQHGPAAERRPQVCLNCHSPANPISPDAAYAQTSFCASCHAGEPMPHPETYRESHAQAAQQAAVSCNQCHSPANPVRPEAPHASPGYCLDCHLNTYQHPEGWVAAHGTVAAGAGGSAQEPPTSCRTCHSPPIRPEVNSCTSCHQNASSDWHPDPYWFIKHGAAAREAGEASCARCHAEVEPSCTQCHRSR